MTTELRKIIKERDDITDEEFDCMIDEARDCLDSGEDPQDVLQEIFSIEPDFIMDLIEEMS